jgi:hypothetical protein
MESYKTMQVHMNGGEPAPMQEMAESSRTINCQATGARQTQARRAEFGSAP